MSTPAQAPHRAPRRAATAALGWPMAACTTLLSGALWAAPAAQPPAATSPPEPPPTQVPATVFEGGPGVLGVSIETLRMESLKAYASPAVGWVVMGLQDMKLSPVNRDGAAHLDLREELQFAFKSHQVPKEARKTLDGLARLLVQHPGAWARIRCHTDDQGDDAYNLALSERRAKAVKDYLVSRGVSEARVLTEGVGEAEPLMDIAGRTPTREERARNRRTEVFIEAPPPAGAEASPGAPAAASGPAPDARR